MQKPQKLRNFLVKAIPELQQNPEQFLIFVEGGNLRSTMAQGLSFEYEYTLSMVFTDYAGELDAVTLPLFQWLRNNQSELLVNNDKKKDIKFNVEVLANDKVDLVIELPLTERVIAKRTQDKFTITYPEEPQYDEASDPQPVTLYDKDGTPLAQWQSQNAPDFYTSP